MKDTNLEVLKKQIFFPKLFWIDWNETETVVWVCGFLGFFFFEVFLSNQDFSKISSISWSIVISVELHIPTEKDFSDVSSAA